MRRVPLKEQAVVAKIYFAGAEPKRRAVCTLQRNRAPVSVAIPEGVEGGDRIMVQREAGDSYRFVRAL